MGKEHYIRFDWAIKRLLRQKANFGVLEGFLTVLLGEKIRIVELLESESNRMSKEDKSNRLDIKALNSKGEIVIIEIQNNREKYYLERILYGVSKAITEHIDRGDAYDHVKKVYSISILYFSLGKGTDYLYQGKTEFRGVHTGDSLDLTAKDKDALLPRVPSDVFPEYYLLQVNEFDKVAVTPLEEWVEYLKTGAVREGTRAPGLDAVQKHLQYYAMSKADRQAYDRYCENIAIEKDVMETARSDGWQEGWEQGREAGWEAGRKEGREKGREEGREEGRREERMDLARRLKSAGFTLEQIASFTGLDLACLADLQ